MIPVANKAGDILTEFIECTDESDLQSQHFPPLLYALIVVRHAGQALMVYNRRRGVSEVPGGGIEKGETTRDCIVRELMEESGQTAHNLRLRGIIKIRVKSRDLQEFAGALYSGDLETVVPFSGTSEIARICLWDGHSVLQDLCEIDGALVNLI